MGPCRRRRRHGVRFQHPSPDIRRTFIAPRSGATRNRAMALPIPLDYEPMNARLVDEVPETGDWRYEPKWDGFRCLAFRDGTQVELRSKSGQPLGRYFPEVVAALQELPATRFVLDGEIVVPLGQGLSFDQLLQRIHPAPSR